MRCILRTPVSGLNLLLTWGLFCLCGYAQTSLSNDPPFYGPFNGIFLADGNGLVKKLGEHDSVLKPDSPWSLYCWVYLDHDVEGLTLVAGVGDPSEEYARYIGLSAGRMTLWLGDRSRLDTDVALHPMKWSLLAATFDGTQFHLFVNKRELAIGRFSVGSVRPELRIAPPAHPGSGEKHFAGKIAGLKILREALNIEEVQKLNRNPPDFALVSFEEGSKSWPVQTHGQAGYRAPQDPATMPTSRAPIPAPPSRLFRDVEKMKKAQTLEPSGENRWTVGSWELLPAPQTALPGKQLSQPGINTDQWIPATVPGTVLSSLVERGIYPDPDFGLNNLAIPESLNQQAYWYRTQFQAPSQAGGRKLTLTLEGINYRAEIWFNGNRLGTITGAFIRGAFDITAWLKPVNVVAVKVSPPPHPGIPQEQSIKGGPGENGGIMCLDGPTFVATEGWDWIPAIRDRDTGIWQPVTLTVSAGVRIGDGQVLTSLPLPQTSPASVAITVPLENTTSSPVEVQLRASMGEIEVTKKVTIAPGHSTVKLTPAEFSSLTIAHPRLWWPNGYGQQELYSLRLSVSQNGSESDVKQLRFGIREISYELSLLDAHGHLRRVEYIPTQTENGNEPAVDVSHSGIREVPAPDPAPENFPPEWKANWKSWVASLAPGAESSSAIHLLDDRSAAPYLVIKVNGVRIACRGGNWGMDDSRKRVSRRRLEPYFKLHHDANLNMIRNWVGQNTEESFYELADEYGLLVWNDFWESTQDYNLEAEDPALFLENARDTILRFRNHPSIALWCGRNEGVPQPIINQGLAELVRTLDGTRYYSPSSNQVNLQNSGPYKYTDPVLYYTSLNHGFSVETGTPSFSTLESFRASVPQPDQWPIDDVWAYHDWHASGNGAMAPFMAEMEAQFGAPTGLEDFERKAQMLNYVDHRAIFEGMNQHLWAPNSGRLLWMTQPAWPSNTWQILSHDYDTQASYYGVKKSCEPVHVQLDLSNFTVTVVNATTEARASMVVKAKVYSLDNRVLLERESKLGVAADAALDLFQLDLAPLFTNGVLLVKLELHDSFDQLVSENLYWLAQDSPSYRALNRLPNVALSSTASLERGLDWVRLRVRLENKDSVAALQSKLTLLDDQGERILPAYYSDNYISLLPGEAREITIDYPPTSPPGVPQVSIRGWNVAASVISVSTNK